MKDSTRQRPRRTSAWPVRYSVCFQRMPASSSCRQTAFFTVHGSPACHSSHTRHHIVWALSFEIQNKLRPRQRKVTQHLDEFKYSYDTKDRLEPRAGALYTSRSPIVWDSTPWASLSAHGDGCDIPGRLAHPWSRPCQHRSSVFCPGSRTQAPENWHSSPSRSPQPAGTNLNISHRLL